MAEIDKKHMIDLFDKVIKEIDIITIKDGKGSIHNMAQGKKPHIIAEVINKTLADTNLEGSTIQQNFFYELKNSKEDTFRISNEYLKAFENFLRIVQESPNDNSSSGIPELNKTHQFTFTPSLPEFPEDNPSFPASPHYQLPIPEFKRVWIKDESFNLTGTHKDRKAQELLIYLQDIVKRKQDEEAAHGRRRPVDYLPVSIISTGNEAYAIQTLFKKKGYPDLRVIIDKQQKGSAIEHNLKSIGCQVWHEDLNKKLESDDVKNKTENPNGFDFTTHLNEDLIKKRYKFYDWLSFEILNLSPEYCFIPVGTGDLYLNILELNKLEIEKHRKGTERDNRFFGHLDVLCKCNFLGASTRNPHSKADKLFTKYNSAFDAPFQNHVNECIAGGYCGEATNIYEIDEGYLKIALEYFDELNIPAEPSGAAGLALFFSMLDDIPKDKTIVIVNTGKLKLKKEIRKREKVLIEIMKKVQKLKKEKQ